MRCILCLLSPLLFLAVASAGDPAALEKLNRQYLSALARLGDAPGVAEERAWVEGGGEGDGPPVSGKLAGLRETYVSERAKFAPAPEGAPAAAPEMPTEWPTSVAIDLDFEVEVVREDAAERVFIYRTPHFEFRADSKLRSSLVRGFSRIFEATFAAIQALPLPFQCVPPENGFPTRLFTNESDYYLAGGPAGSAGVYIGRTGTILIPLENLGVKKVGKGYSFDSREPSTTLKHELVHQVCRASRIPYPTWYSEGSAEYVAAAKYRNGRYTFTGIGSASRDYLKERKGVWDAKHLAESVERLMDITPRAWNRALGNGSINNYATAAMMVMYFHKWDEGDGLHVRNYLLDLKAGKEEKVARAEHLLRGRTYAQLEEAIAKAWRGEGLKLEFKHPGEAG